MFLETSRILGLQGQGVVIHAIQYRTCQGDIISANIFQANNSFTLFHVTNNVVEKPIMNCIENCSLAEKLDRDSAFLWKCLMGRRGHGWWLSKKSRDFCWENKKFFNTNTPKVFQHKYSKLAKVVVYCFHRKKGKQNS